MMFITIEGCNSAGKTTLAQAVAMNLSKRGYSVQSGYGPGFIFTPHQVARCTPTRAATIFFDALQARRGYAPGFVLTPRQMARLTPAQAATIFFDDLQAQQVDFDSIPERTILLQDRWAESTYVYQGLVGAASDSELRDAIYRRARQMTAPELRR
jgi:thymidylate kinase